ncbi:MAG: family 43 glycosylhydrolase [Eubacteriales bacterium]|nr:family 43 glycosylhydrolase [Eubacteriales bacterium]
MNPILPNEYYIPDAEVRVEADGTVYLYGSKDIPGDDCYCSREYQVFSSKDLIVWKASDISFSTQMLREKTQSRLYAPDCVRYHGRYYLLYCLADGKEGIAESGSPEGPFQDKGIIEGISGIDPSVYVEGDTVYYFWGQMSLQGATIDLETGRIDEASHVSGILTQERDGFHEGSSIRKIGEKYYLVYTDISRGRATCLGYATADHPLGPYEKKGIIIDNTGCDPSSWNDHGSIQEIDGQYYVFYHRSTNNSFFSRRVCAEKITINPDGTIDEVEMTSQGVENAIDCRRALGASAFCRITGQAYLTDYTDAENSYSVLTNVHAGDGAQVRYYDFSQPVSEFAVRAANPGEEAGIKVRLDAEDGEVIAVVSVGRSRGGYDFREWAAPLTREVSGHHAVYLEFTGADGKLMNLKEFVFR